MVKKIKCPYCGYTGEPSDFTYMYETVLYMTENHVIPEERERPILVICPRCRQGFFLKSPYSKLIDKIMEEK